MPMSISSCLLEFLTPMALLMIHHGLSIGYTSKESWLPIFLRNVHIP